MPLHVALEVSVFWLCAMLLMRFVMLHKQVLTVNLDIRYMTAWTVLYGLQTLAHIGLGEGVTYSPGSWLVAKTVSAAALLFVAIRPVAKGSLLLFAAAFLPAFLINVLLLVGDADLHFAFGRPLELIPLALFVSVIIFDKFDDPVGRAVRGVAAVSAVSHFIMLFSSQIYDAAFQIAHMLAVFAFVPVIWEVWWKPISRT